jgi:uncharacterized integral membrane protein
MDNFNIIIYVAFLIGGLIFIGVAINQYMKAKKAEKTWLTAPGVVLNSDIQVRQSRSSRGQTTRSYLPQVSYQYQVKDQTYTGDRLGFGSGSYGKGKANKIIAVYPQGAQVTVHYDPADPSKAVLETKATAGGSLLALGIILLVMGVVLIFVLSK